MTDNRKMYPLSALEMISFVVTNEYFDDMFVILLMALIALVNVLAKKLTDRDFNWFLGPSFAICYALCAQRLSRLGTLVALNAIQVSFRFVGPPVLMFVNLFACVANYFYIHHMIEFGKTFNIFTIHVVKALVFGNLTYECLFIQHWFGGPHIPRQFHWAWILYEKCYNFVCPYWNFYVSPFLRNARNFIFEWRRFGNKPERGTDHFDYLYLPPCEVADWLDHFEGERLNYAPMCRNFLNRPGQPSYLLLGLPQELSVEIDSITADFIEYNERIGSNGISRVSVMVFVYDFCQRMGYSDSFNQIVGVFLHDWLFESMPYSEIVAVPARDMEIEYPLPTAVYERAHPATFVGVQEMPISSWMQLFNDVEDYEEMSEFDDASLTDSQYMELRFGRTIVLDWDEFRHSLDQIRALASISGNFFTYERLLEDYLNRISPDLPERLDEIANNEDYYRRFSLGHSFVLEDFSLSDFPCLDLMTDDEYLGDWYNNHHTTENGSIVTDSFDDYEPLTRLVSEDEDYEDDPFLETSLARFVVDEILRNVLDDPYWYPRWIHLRPTDQEAITTIHRVNTDGEEMVPVDVLRSLVFPYVGMRFWIEDSLVVITVENFSICSRVLDRFVEARYVCLYNSNRTSLTWYIDRESRNQAIHDREGNTEHTPDRRISMPRPREVTLFTRESFWVQDGNHQLNLEAINSLKPGQSVRLHGRTCIGNRRFNFPVYCTFDVFKNFLAKVEPRFPGRRDLFADGTLTYEFYDKYRELWAERCVTRLCSGDLLEEVCDTLKHAEPIPQLLTLSWNLWQRDYIAVAGWMSSNPELCAKAMCYGSAAYHEILECFGDVSDDPPATSRLVGPDLEERSFFDFLPTHIKASPRVRKILGLTSAMMLSTHIKEMALVKSIIEHLPAIDLTSLNIVKACMEVFKSLYDFFCNSGSWSDFFDLPGRDKFLKEAYEVLEVEKYAFSREEIEKQLSIIEKLILSTHYHKSDSEVSRVRAGLESRKAELLARLGTPGTRFVPFPTLLFGDSGTGKTSLLWPLMEHLSRKRGEKVAPNGFCNFPTNVMRIDLTNRFPASGTDKNPMLQYVVVNDLVAEHGSDTMKGLVSLEPFIQGLQDTLPFKINSADIPDKDREFNYIEASFFTTNAFCWNLENPADRLLRRIDFGVCVDVRIVDEKGRPVKSKVFKHWSQEKRQSQTKFYILEPKESDKKIYFERTGIVYDWTEFFDYYEQVYTHYLEDRISDVERFRVICECGLPMSFHYVESGVFSRLNGLCPQTTLTSDIGSIFLGMSIVVAFYMLGQTLSKIFNALLREFRHSPIIPFCCEVTSTLSETRAASYRVWAQFLRVRNFFYRHRKSLIVAFALVGVLAYGRRTRMVGGTIIRERIGEPWPDPVVERELAYPQDVGRSWGKDDKMQNRVTFEIKNVSGGDMWNIIGSSCKLVDLACDEFNGKHLTVGVFVLDPNRIMMNKHQLKKVKSKFTLTFGGQVRFYELNDVINSKRSEMCYVPNDFWPMAKNLTGFFPDDISCNYIDFLSYTHQGQIWAKGTARRQQFEADQMYPTYEWNGGAEPGFCGRPVVATFREGAVVVGFVAHDTIRWDGRFAGCTIVTREMFKEDLPNTMLVGDIIVDDIPQITDMNAKSELRNVPFSGDFWVYGTRPGANSSFKSKFRRTRVAAYFENELSEPYAPPHKIRGEHNGEWLSAVVNTFKYSALWCDATWYEWKCSADSYLLRLKQVFKEVKARPLTQAEAIKGCPEMGIGPMAMDTSMGETLREVGIHTKRDLFTEIEGQYEYVWSQPFLEQVAKMRAVLLRGDIPVTRVKAATKDEIRPVSKLEQFKIRLFWVLDGFVNTEQRRYVMPLISLLLLHPVVSECFGQINAGSMQWHQLALYLREGSEKFFDADYSAYDMSHKRRATWAFAYVMFELSKIVGYTPEESEMTFRCCYMLAYQMGVYKNDIFFKFYGMPSGAIITLIMNSICNSLIYRIVFTRLTNKPINDFHLYIKLATTGDDNVAGVHKDLVGVFTQRAFANAAAHLGYKVTPASKENELQDYLEFEDLRFLKRSFRFDERLGHYMAPIDTDSIFKSLCFENVEAGISPPERLMAACETAQREAYLHGKEFFDCLRTKLIDVFSKEEIGMSSVITRHLLSFEAIEEEHLNGTFKTWMA